MTEMPQSVADVLTDAEIENIENRRGWAIGTVVLDQNGERTRRIDDAIIELFNGEGEADAFGGVKFLAEDGGEYEEAYAFATKTAYDQSSQSEGWYVDSWTDPTNPNYGQPAP